MATPDPRTTQIEAWSVREAQQTSNLTGRTEQTIWSLFALWLLTRWFSDDERDQAGREAARIVEESRAIAGNVGGAYIGEVIAVATGRRARPRPIVLPPARNGADLTQVYSRPVEAYRREFSVTGDATRAQTAARARLRELITTDLMLARRDGEASGLGVDVTALSRVSPLTDPRGKVYTLPIADGPAVVDLADLEPQTGTGGTLLDSSGAPIEILGYRRIVHPERSETGVCGLCLAASDRVYTLGELLPIHGRCQCTIAPITDEYDPGESNIVDLEQLYLDAGGGNRRQRTTDGRKLKDVRYQVNEHGEYGLLLSRSGDRSQREGEAPKGDPVARARTELAALEPVLTDLERRADAGEDVAAPLAYQRNRVAKLRDITGA